MPYAFRLRDSLVIRANLIPCAHMCRYCCISSNGEHHVSPLSFERFFALADRFKEWGTSSGFSVFPSAHNSDDITDRVATFLDNTIGPPGTVHEPPITPDDAKLRMGTVRTGGVRFRSDDEIRAWLARWRDAGSTKVHGTFAGYKEIHDWWNNREGDYDFLIRIQEIAVEMGFEISQTIFLMKNILPSLGKLVADLNHLPSSSVNRHVVPAAYLGRARSEVAERERMTEEDRDYIRELGLASGHQTIELKSERERLGAFQASEADMHLHSPVLRVDERNIGYLESTSCDEIVSSLQAKIAAAYYVLPGRDELMERYSDQDGMKIYGSYADVERLWFDRYIRDGNVPLIEHEVTHLF